MRKFLSIFAFLPFLASGEIVGWICRVELMEYHSKKIGNSWQGEYTGQHAYLWRYFPQTSTGNAPTLSTWGLQYDKDLGLNPVPNPISGYFDMWLVIAHMAYRVDNSNGADVSSFQPFNESKPLSPVYNSSAGNPYLFDTGEYGRFLGFNNDFGAGGSLDIIQGQFSQPNGDLPVYITYDSEGYPVLSKSMPQNAYEFVYNPSSGKYDLYPVQVTGSGSLDLTPVVNAIETQGGYTRSQLVDLLGSNGSSWVYDCRLSLSQLYDLATSFGLIVDLRFNSQLDDLNSSVQSVNSTIINKDFSPTINVAAPEVTVNVPAPNVTVNPAEVNIDTSSLATESTLSKLNTRFHTYNSNFYTFFQSYLLPYVQSIRDTLNSWNTGNTVPSTLPQPDLGNDSPDDNLPDFAKAAWSGEGVLSDSSVGQIFGDMVDWGDNGTPTMIVPDFISGFLSTFIGSIPSVGSDPNMFDFSIELPYIGLVQKHWSWSDFPYVSDFRAFLVWLVYLFFGLACFKLLHRTLI